MAQPSASLLTRLRAALLPTPAPVLPVIPTKALGNDGIANFGGRIRYEPIEELRDQAGFGRSGTTEWGFWENLEASNSFIAQALDFATSPIGDALVDVEEPDLEDKALAKQVTDFVRWNLTQRMRVSEHLQNASRGALKSGFSLYEPVYEQVKGGRWAGRWALKSLEPRLTQSLDQSPWVESDGKLVAIKQLAYRDGMSQRTTLPADRVLLYIWQRQGNNWTGRSAFRAVQYIAGKVMPTLLKLIGVTLQREGAGIPTAYSTDANAELTPEQRDQLAETLANITFHEAASLVMPTGWKMDWIFSAGANKGHVFEIWQQLGVACLQCLGAQQLALGTADTGSRSVGETHDARSAVKVREILRFLEATINGDSDDAFVGLIPRLCRFNGWELSAYPRIKLTLQRPEMGVADMAEAAKTAKDAGLLTVTMADENAIRERMGLQPIDEATWRASKSQPAPVAPPAAGVPAAGAMSASLQRGAWKPWRPLRASETKLKLEDLDAYFTKQRDDFAAKARPLVLAMLAKAAPSIQSAMADGNPSEVAALPFDSKRLDAFINEFLAQTRKTGGDFAREELGGDLKLVAADPTDLTDPTDAEVVYGANAVQHASALALSRRIQNRLRQEIEREAIDTIRTGGDAGDVVARVVERQVDSGAYRGDAGAVVTKLFNVGRDEAAQLVGGVAQVEYTAILDSATCGPCRAMDGKRADFNSPEHDAMVPPNRDCAGGDNCRCLLVFIPAEQEAA